MPQNLELLKSRSAVYQSALSLKPELLSYHTTACSFFQTNETFTKIASQLSFVVKMTSEEFSVNITVIL